MLRLWIFIAVATIAVSCQSKKDGRITIGEKGTIRAIAVSATSDSVTKFASKELQSYLRSITGVELPIEDVSSENCIQFVQLDKDSSIKWDGFKIAAADEKIILSANEPRALLYAAYTLLEKIGCSFMYPGKNEEVVPHKKLVEVPAQTKTYNPLLEHRGLAPYGLQASSVEDGRNFIDWMAKNKLNLILVSENRPSDSDGPANGSIWKEVTKELLPELRRRGFVIEMSEHCMPVFFPRSLFKEHPTWFALNNGKRELGPPPYSGQMCYGNKDAVEYYASAVASYAKDHPEFHIIGTWPLDGGEYCECEKCSDPQTVFRAAMRVAEKVKAVRPDMVVEHLAYKVQTWQPPAMEKIPDNMSILWTSDEGVREPLVKQWVQKSENAGGVYRFEYNMGDNYHLRTNVWLRPMYAASVVKHATGLKFKGVISLYLPIQNWWRASFNNWFFAHSSWDENFNVDSSLNVYYENYYGEQAGRAKEIFTLLLNKLQREPYHLPEEAASYWNDTLSATASSILEKIGAAQREASDPKMKTRWERVKTYVEFFRMHGEAFTSRSKSDFENLVRYSKDRPGQQMVLMYPGYIRWRNEEFF